MSANPWDSALASANGLLTSEECSLLLDIDIFGNDDDLLKTLPSAAPKIEYNESSIGDELCGSLYPPSPPELKPTRAQLANDLLQQLENQRKQENIFSNWLEEKVDLPIFENISQVPERVEPAAFIAPPAVAYNAPQPTEELLREFESVYGVVELTHLTPPQSPPGPATQLLQSYAQQAQCGTGLQLVPVQEPWGDACAPAAPVAAHAPLAPLAPPHYECEVDVDELVHSRAAQFASPCSGSASPRSSPPSSPRSCSTDEEWSAPSRPKPYSRSVDDRRSRKKEQNKNAATRYRQKKKAEIEVLLTEEQNLRQRHSELGDKCSDLQREIRYLKGLMRDLLKAKGLIK